MQSWRRQELIPLFGANTYRRGQEYALSGRVAGLALDGRGRLLGRVRGSARNAYHCVVQLSRRTSGQLSVDGHCTCPVGYNCKHVVAVLLKAEERPSMAPGEPGPATSLEGPLRLWLSDLRDIARPAEPRRTIPERLLYVLSRAEGHGPQWLELTVWVARQLKNGAYGTLRHFSGGSWSAARYVAPADTAILRQWEIMARPLGGTGPLKGEWGARLLQDLLASGRCHWESADSPPLKPGPARRGEFAWVMDPQGVQSLRLQVEGAADAVLPLAPPYYMEGQQFTCGAVETGLPAAMAERLMLAPPVPPEAAPALASALSEILEGKAAPLPQQPEVRKVEGVPPVGCLHLGGQEVATPYSLRSYREPANLFMDYARLSFEYEGRVVAPHQPGPSVRLRTADGLVEVMRSRKQEADLEQQLEGAGMELAPEIDASCYVPDGEGCTWPVFMLEVAPELRKHGWRITEDETFSFRMAQPSEWHAEVEESREGWFELGLDVEVDGKRMPLLPLLAGAIDQFPHLLQTSSLAELPDNHVLLLRLDDGRLLPMPLGRIKPLLSTLIELYDPGQVRSDGKLRLSRFGAAQVADLAEAVPAKWHGADTLRAFGERLRGFKKVSKAPLPAGLGTRLRGYQHQGLSWLQFLRHYDLCGILADDMGLGKTVQTLAHLLLERQQARLDRPALVVAPTSLVTNWRREAERFAPSLKVLVLHGPQRRTSFEGIPRHDLVITTYPLLVRDAEALSSQDYHLVVLDEAQAIKNPRARAGQVARTLRARHRLCLTGTPIENHLGELWSLFQFLMPGFLWDQASFRRLFRNPIEKDNDQSRQQWLARRVAPFLLRRTKAEVERELPPKTEIVRSVELEGAQRDLYETLRLAMHAKVRSEIARKGMERSHVIILDALLKLRQVCCDPRLVKLNSARRVTQSAKLAMLTELLPEMLDEGRRVLLFSQFTSMLSLIETELDSRSIGYVKLTGQTRDRATPIDRFQTGAVPLFLISLKAGGTGLNLTAADTVIHYDPWWNPAVENQATDRAHRIGQDKPVFVYKLLTEGTVEQKIAALQDRKKKLAEALFVEGGKGAAKLSGKDLDFLFAPLT